MGDKATGGDILMTPEGEVLDPVTRIIRVPQPSFAPPMYSIIAALGLLGSLIYHIYVRDKIQAATPG